MDNRTFDFEYTDRHALEKALFEMDRRRSAIIRMRKLILLALLVLISFPLITGIILNDELKTVTAAWLLATLVALDAHAPPRVVVYRGEK